MDEFYAQMNYNKFLADLSEKDYCILLQGDNLEIRGFSTLQIVTIQSNGRAISGVFSGDTIIHQENWGSLELFKTFAQFVFALAKEYQEFYWFLISKGYKTYKMLPLFFKEFYPNYQVTTADYEQSILHAFGHYKFSDEYCPVRGVVKYQAVKDTLRPGVADITEKQLRDKNIAFFVEKNPGYAHGEDLVCIAKFDQANLRSPIRRLLLGE